MSTPIYRDIVDAAEQNGLNTKYVASTHGGEHHGPCPECGGTDRFILHPNYENENCKGRYWCRQCDIKGDFIDFCRKYCGCESFEEAVACANGRMPSNFTKSSGKRSRKIAAPTAQPASPQPRHIIAPASPMWQEQAARLINEAYETLLKNPETLKWLAEQRGLPHGAVERYKFGWLHEYKRFAGSLWNESREEVVIPAGLLIPTLGKDVKPRRLKVRCKDWHPQSAGAKFIAIPGSMEGLNLIGDSRNKKVVIVEAELDAFAIDYAIGDIVCVIAVGGSNKKPDGACAYIAQSAELLLICHDNDAAGIEMLHRWREVNPTAIAYPTPMGKDIGEAVALGLNIREFFLAIIHQPAIDVAQPETVSAEAMPPAETITPTIILPAPEEHTQEQMASNNDTPIVISLSETTDSFPVYDEQQNTFEQEFEYVNQPLLTPLNDLKMLVIWATEYFNRIPDAYRLPSDRRLLKEIDSVEADMVSEVLQKELRCVYRVATDKIL